MGVLRAVVVMLLASGCTEVVVDPFDVQVDPPPVLVDLVIDVQGAFAADGFTLFVSLPALGRSGEESVLSGRAAFVFVSAIEAGTSSVLVAGFFDRDFDRCCHPEIDASFGAPVALEPLGTTYLRGFIELEPMAELPMEGCPFFEVGDPACMRMEMPGP